VNEREDPPQPGGPWQAGAADYYVSQRNGPGPFCVLSRICKREKHSRAGPYPSDLHEIGCKIDGKTRPVVLVMVPRPENGKQIEFY
jgi:hypothetical protein